MKRIFNYFRHDSKKMSSFMESLKATKEIDVVKKWERFMHSPPQPRLPSATKTKPTIPSGPEKKPANTLPRTKSKRTTAEEKTAPIQPIVRTKTKPEVVKASNHTGPQRPEVDRECAGDRCDNVYEETPDGEVPVFSCWYQFCDFLMQQLL